VKTAQQLTPQELVASLKSTTCPACSMSKGKGKTLCGCCFYALPDVIQGRLYKRIGQGYEEAFAGAMRHLKVARPTMPPDAD
jgi:tRNA(Ile2) C34 agmatinyltransferase TiaS